MWREGEKTLLFTVNFMEIFKRDNEQCFLYLPSNVNSVNTQNTPEKFRIPLAQPLVFDSNERQEAALSEIFFPSSYYNITSPLNECIEIKYHILRVSHSAKIIIKQGHYNVASYVKELKKEMKKIKKEKVFQAKAKVDQEIFSHLEKTFLVS